MKHTLVDMIIEMPLLTKKITEVIPPATYVIDREIRRLEDPADYFAGVAAPSLLLPQKVLLFRRRELPRQGKSHHHRHVLIVAVHVAGRVVIDDGAFLLREGHALMVFPFQFHGYQCPREKRLLWLFITFEGEFGDALECFQRGPVKLSSVAVNRLKDLLVAYNRRDADRALSVQLLGALLLDELRRTAERLQRQFVAPAAGDDLTSAVCRFVQSHIDKGLRIKDLARHLKISASNLRLTFRRGMGMSLGKYIAEIRLLRAASLLHSSNLRLRQIAGRCGYDSPYSLSRAFKRRMGRSPKQYRTQRKVQ